MAGRPSRANRTVVLLLGAYIVLWIVEGAFRKWVPSTNLVFYIARDAYAVGVIVWLATSRITPLRRVPWWAIGAVGLLAVWMAAQIVVTRDAVPEVLAFGMRSYLAPLLFALLCYRYATFDTMLSLSKLIVWAAPLEFALTVLQVLAPADSFINIEVGGEANIFVNGGDVVRATGSFSAPIGLTLYLIIALAIALWWTTRDERRITAWVLVAATLTMVALSGARGNVLNSAIVLAAYVAVSLVKPSPGSVRRVVAILVLLVVAVVGVQIALPQVLGSFITRFNDASASENTGTRIFDTVTLYIGQWPTLLGDGMGTRSNAGIALGSSAGWIENDGLRWVAELGVLGYLLALLRTAATIWLVISIIWRVRTDSAATTLIRTTLVALLALASLNGTPTSEGGFAIVLGFALISERTRTPRPAVVTPAGRPEAVAAR